MKKKAKRLIVWIVVILVLVAAAIVVLPRFVPGMPVLVDVPLPALGNLAGPPGGDEGPVDAFAVPVAVRGAWSGPARETLLLYGSVFAQREVSIFTTVNGKAKRILVAEGDYVRENQVLAEIDRDQAGLKFATAEVTSTMAGIVKTVLTEVGATVSPAAPLFQIVDMDVVEIVVDVPEKMIARVRVGQPVEIAVVSYPSRSFSGRVSKTAPVVDPASRTLETRIRVANSSYLLKPGMFAEARIILREESDIVQIPLSSLVDKEYGRVAFVVQGDVVRQIAPEIAFVEGETAAVASGISAGAQVVVVGQQNLNDGDPISVAEVRE
jgi:multidrug efflux pump subunit AcrA (membrane-fusion protein)